MPDPYKLKNKQEIWLETRLTDNGVTSDITFSALIDGKRLTETPEEEVKAQLASQLEVVRLSPLSGIYLSRASFSYQDPKALEDFNYGNVFVAAHLPYCLHLPNHYEFEVDLPQINIKVLITHRKVWTKKAEEGVVRSSETDLYAKDQVTYFNNSVFLPPRLPIDLEDGWQQEFTGRNLERIKDQNGTFRFSALYIQFQKTVSEDDLRNQARLDTIMEEVQGISLKAVNRLIDTYRSVTRNGYVQRLGSLEINTIYFTNLSKGFYILSSGFGIETAVINRSKDEIVKIEKALLTDIKPDLYDLLLLDAQMSFDNRNYPLSVVQSFQGLEIFLENFHIKELQGQGKSETEVAKYLTTNWQTKTRLKESLKELKGTTLYEANQGLWEKWCTLYDQTRNEIIHKGKEPTQKEVREMLETNIQVIEWLKTL